MYFSQWHYDMAEEPDLPDDDEQEEQDDPEHWLPAAVERLFSACLDVTLAGKYHAHIHYSAHCGEVSVLVLPADTNYRDLGYAYLLNESVYIHHDFLTDADAACQINVLIDKLNAYRAEDAA